MGGAERGQHRWMQRAFDEARARGLSAIMLISQANPGWDLSDATRAPLRDPRTLAQTDGQPDGFQDFLLACARKRRLPQAGCLPARGLPLFPHRQTVPRPAGPAARELHADGDIRQQRGPGNNDVQWVKVLVDSANSRSLRLPAANCSRKPDSGPCTLRLSRPRPAGVDEQTIAVLASRLNDAPL